MPVHYSSNNIDIIVIVCTCLDMSSDIRQCLTEMETCFNLLLPRMDTWNTDCFDVDLAPNSAQCSGSHDDDSAQSDDSDEEDWVEVGPSTYSAGLEGHGISGREFNLTITLPEGKNTLLLEETEDNQSIFESLRGCHVLCSSTHLPMVNKWLQVIIDCGIQL